MTMLCRSGMGTLIKDTYVSVVFVGGDLVLGEEALYWAFKIGLIVAVFTFTAALYVVSRLLAGWYHLQL